MAYSAASRSAKAAKCNIGIAIGLGPQPAALTQIAGLLAWELTIITQRLPAVIAWPQGAEPARRGDIAYAMEAETQAALVGNGVANRSGAGHSWACFQYFF